MTLRAALMALVTLWLVGPAAAATESPVTPAPEPPAPTVVLDPGHGGHDLGAEVGRWREKDIALAIARRVKKKLEKMGPQRVVLTRDADVYVPLDQRIDESLDAGSLAFVSLHLNQTRSRKPHGITIYSFGRQTTRLPVRRHHLPLPKLPAPPRDEAVASAKLASSLVASLRSQGFRVDPPAHARFYVLKNPRVPSVLIELGYLSNPAERARLASPKYQDKLARALAVSLRSYVLRSATASAAPAPAGAASGGR